MAANPIKILLVEDNDGDFRLTKEALEGSKIHNHLHRVADGVEAMSYLRKEGEFADVSTPDLVLLDLNLPKKDGREVLMEIKSDSKLKRIPVVILTTSDADEDIFKAYDNYANCYIKKPVDFDQFANVVQKIESFWFSIVKLPGVK